MSTLSLRQLNRATLERQLLLNRSPRRTLDVVEHLVGLQSQIPLNPYTALWSRLIDFDPAELSQHLSERAVVRIVLMRGTIHLVTADDALRLRPLVQPVLDAELARHSQFGPALRAADLDPVLAVGRELLSERALTGTELRAEMRRRFPTLEPAALAYACRNHLALVQVPPRGLWGAVGQVRSTSVEAWLGRPLDRTASLDTMVVRYLAAFGPASVADVSSWCRLTGMREIVERLGPRLVTYRDPSGRELFDLAEAPIPDEETPAPPRVLPEYDNVLLSHADRSRFSGDQNERLSFALGPPIHGTILVDGMVSAVWRLERDRRARSVTMRVSYNPARAGGAAASTVYDEAMRYLVFSEPNASEVSVELSVDLEGSSDR